MKIKTAGDVSILENGVMEELCGRTRCRDKRVRMKGGITRRRGARRSQKDTRRRRRQSHPAADLEGGPEVVPAIQEDDEEAAQDGGGEREKKTTWRSEPRAQRKRMRLRAGSV